MHIAQIDLDNEESVQRAVDAFKAAWGAADSRGEEGGRVRHALVAALWKRPIEPGRLFAVVEDSQGSRWFRWAHDSHTHFPWRLVGDVHADTEDDRRWVDILAVEVISDGLE